MRAPSWWRHSTQLARPHTGLLFPLGASCAAPYHLPLTNYHSLLTTHHSLLTTQAEAAIQTANAIMQLPSVGRMATQLDLIAGLLR